MTKSDKGLEDKQEAFCREYTQDFNATQAAIRAGYSSRSAKQIGARLLSKDDVQKEISAQIETLLEQTKIPLKKQLFDFWMKRAFYDITELIDPKGVMKLSTEQIRKKGLQVCIDSINRKINSRGETIITYQFADKDKAADMLQKYIQMIREQVDVTGNVTLNIMTQDQALI